MHSTLAGSLQPIRGRSNYHRHDADEPARIGLVHSDPIMRAGLSSALAAFEDFEVETSARGMPLVIADYVSALSILESAARPPHRGPHVIVAGGDRECEIRRALALGAKGYLVSSTLDELVRCVRAVHRGERYLSPLAATRLAESVCCEPLTGREKEVMRLVAMGLANKQIASQLGIAVYTVKSHLKSIFEKLQVRSRTQAMALAGTRGMLEATPS